MLIELILLFLVIFIPLIFSKQVYYLNNSIIGRFILIIAILLLSMCRTYLALILIIIIICLSQVNYDNGIQQGYLDNTFRDTNNKINSSYDLLNIMNILNNNNNPLSSVDIENENDVINPYNENETNKKTIYNVDNIILT